MLIILKKLLIINFFFSISLDADEIQKGMVGCGYKETWVSVNKLPSEDYLKGLKTLDKIESVYGASTFYDTFHLPKFVQIDTFEWFLIDLNGNKSSFTVTVRYDENKMTELQISHK